MPLDPSPHDLLAHFDHPKTLALHEASWVDEIETAATVEPPPAPPAATLPIVSSNARRNARWVLKYAMAVAVLMVAASQLIEFACLCSAEHSLNLAARAGADEATLPRATYKSITAAVDRTLAAYPQLNGRTQLTVLQNGRPVGRQLRPGENGRISVTLTAPASAFTPRWLLMLPRWSDDTDLIAHAERTTPSHKLRPEHSQTAAE